MERTGYWAVFYRGGFLKGILQMWDFSEIFLRGWDSVHHVRQMRNIHRIGSVPWVLCQEVPEVRREAETKSEPFPEDEGGAHFSP